MRPNKFRSEVYKAIHHRVVTGSNSRFTPYLIRAMENEYKKLVVIEDDYRVGTETYSYLNKETIEADLFYINDRWNCAFRLRWLLDGLREGKI